MGRRITVGVLLGIAGAAMFFVSIWLLADTTKTEARGFSAVLEAGDSSRVGIAAGILAVVVGLVCCFVTSVEEKKNILLAAIFIVLALSVASLGVAAKHRIDLQNIENVAKLNIPNAGQFNFGVFKKIKTQLVVMAVASGLAAVLEIVAMILAARFRPPQSSRNAMQMEKSF